MKGQKKIKKSEVTFPSGHSILFNETFEFEQGLLEEEFNAVQKECLKSFEALCVLGYKGYQEFYKNFLFILVEMHYQISHKKTPVPKRIMATFGVSTGWLVAHMLRRGKLEPTKLIRHTEWITTGPTSLLEIVLPNQFNFLWEHYLQGQHLLKNVDMGGRKPMLLNISK
jgi:hypothetical protein